MGEGGPKVQTSSDKTNKFWGFHVQHGGDNPQCRIVYLKTAKRVDLKTFRPLQKDNYVK